VPISACIITFNEADRIGDCLASLAFCDEIVVIDSGSTDTTREIAAAAGARVLERAFTGFRSQKQFAVDQARHDWVLCLDADERVSPELRTALLAARDAGFADAAGYRFARLSEYFGRFLRRGNAYPDRVLRLFDRRRGGWRGDREIHEAASVDGAVKTLPGDLIHYPYRSLMQQLQKTERYARMMA
jgi:glycosyltransferase involved in cell wall biosynthesis